VRTRDADPLQQPAFGRVTLRGLVHLRLTIRRCGHYPRAWRPEAEDALALPQHKFGLDVVALIGSLRYRGTAAPRRSIRS